MGTVPEASGGEQAPIVATQAAPVAGPAAPATPTSGLLVVDKPRGVTSHDIVAAARGALHMKKVGHAGTLDPMATGVLVVGFGNATRLLNHIVEHDKTYEATIRLGQSTTTDDADGELLSATSPERWQELLALPVAGGPQSAGENGPVNAAKGSAVAAAKVADDGSAYHPHQEAFLPDGQQLWRDRIDDIIALQLTGSIEQVPNTFSAIKINGQRAYDLARDGKDVQLKARRITVSAFGVLDVRFGYAPTRQLGLPLVSAADGRATTERDDAEATPVIDVDVRVSCSAGTYIRALGRDLGAALGVGGHLIRLRRTRVGGFDVSSPNVITAHVETREYTDRNGNHQSRNRAVLDVIGDELAGKALRMPREAPCRCSPSPIRTPSTCGTAGVSPMTSTVRPPRICRRAGKWWRSSSAPSVARPSRPPYSARNASLCARRVTLCVHAHSDAMPEILIFQRFCGMRHAVRPRTQ